MSTTATEKTVAETWIAGFAEGWRAPGGPDAFSGRFRKLLASNVRLIQPQLPTLGGRLLSSRVCGRVALLDGVAVERESYFDPTALIGTVLKRPRAWPRFVRLQARQLVNRRIARSRA